MSHKKLEIKKAIEELKCQSISALLERESIIYNLENQPRLRVLDARLDSLELAINELEKLVA